MLRRRRRTAGPLDHVEPATLPARWELPVQGALDARSRYAQVATTLPQGPLQQRVEELAERVDAGVLATWDAARRGAELEAVLRATDLEGATAAHKAALREVGQARSAGAVPPALEQRAAALAERHASLQRLANALDDTAEQLSLLEARLEAAVVKVAELALRPDSAPAALSADLESLVDELGALRSALDGLDRTPGAHG